MSSKAIANEICTKSERFSHPPMGEEIVISGLAGRFPKSDNIKLLQENLMNKIDLITDDAPSLKSAYHGVLASIGKANNTEKFDAAFFGISAKQADKMDPKGRMLLEHTYEAVIDAGINPRHLHGTKTGVFIGTCSSESNNVTVFDARKGNELGILGGSHYMMANRISSWFGFRGPSTVIDTACSSSLSAMEHAYAAMRHGRCDAAIVGGANLLLIPNTGLQFTHLGMLSPDGRCKVFDEAANGYVRSDTIAVALLQKAKNAKRIYAYMIHAKSNNDGFTDQGITMPSSKMQASLLKALYTECGVSPATIKYVEAHGTSTRVGDPKEMKALEEVFLDGRTTPLFIGSIKSNLGHAEPASGVCSIIKVVIAMECGYIPPNLHFKNPRKQLKGLCDERMRVVTEPTAWQGGYIGINSFGFGGSNAHVLLKSHEKEKINGGSPKDDLPRLVVVSGRNQEAVWCLLNELKSRPVDVEFVRLLHDIHESEIPGHLYRGFTILPARDLSESVPQSCHRYRAVERPVWFVFSEVRSALTGVGESLLRFPVFSEAIERCNLALKHLGVDVFNILRNKNPKTFDNVPNVIVGIIAIQVGLVDLLTSVEIAPDNVISNSVGELMSAYTDGCLTTEQTILAAYFYGLACLEMNTAGGSMATLSLGNSELQTLYPNDIEVARFNVSDGTCLTINEHAEPETDCLSEFLKPEISEEKPQCSDTAHDKRYITKAGTKLLANLRKIITHPKPRSIKWLSDSVSEDKWTSESAELCSAEYLTNILLNPVLLEERLLTIPRNAILVEITPQGLVNQALRKLSTANIIHVALTDSKRDDNVVAVLYALGELYEMGLNPRLQSLYPEVQYPVSRGTSMISPLVRWNHSENWDVSATKPIPKLRGSKRKIKIDPDHEFVHRITGHRIDGKNLIPAAGYLILIWETLAMMEGKIFTDVSVVFEHVEFISSTTIPQEGDVVLELVVDRGTGNFAVLEGDEAIVTGTARSVSNPITQFARDATTSVDDNVDSEEMSARDVYKTFRIRGYQYSGLFRSITKANLTGTRGHISWNKNWIAFVENMLQMYILGTNSKELLVPTFIEKFVVDVPSHWNLISKIGGEHPELPVKVQSDYGAIISGGMEIRGLRFARINRRKLGREPVHEKSLFVAHRDQAESTLEPLIRLAVHIAVENQIGLQIKVIEFIDESNDVSIECLASPHVQTIFSDLPTLQADVIVIASGGNVSNAELPSSVKFESQLPLNVENVLLAVTHELIASQNMELLNLVRAVTTERGFILAIEPLKVNTNFVVIQEHFDVILEKRTDKKSIILLRKKSTPTVVTSVIRVNNDEYTWLHKLQAALQAESNGRNNANNRILLVSESDFGCGIEGLVTCLRKEPGGKHIQELFIQDIEAPEFSLDNLFYSKQVKLDLVHNVLRPGGVWGSYRWLPFDNLVPRIVHHASVNQDTPGDLTSFQCVEGPIQSGPNVNETCNIYYSSLNFRDIMLATGKLKVKSTANERPIDECVTGVEYSGVNATDGRRRVMGIISSGALSNVCIPDRNLQWEVPDDWTLEDAATIPVAYGTSYYSLHVIGRMKRGEKVLIHSGCGGVGQAAIRLALHERCEVFTTVGTTSKRKFIKERFPQIDDNHIGNSRDTSFEELILRKTQGRGVDIVLNSLTGEKLRASLRCLARGGRFLEIGKVDLVANTQIGMEIFSKEIHFYSVHLDRVLNGTVEEKQRVKSLIDKGRASGVVEPLVRTVFAKEKIEAAFRYMTTGRHIGKVLIKIRNDDGGCASLFYALPRFYCLSGSSYLIHGGLGGFGLELAEWLVQRGATRLVLTSSRGITTGYQRRRLHFWKASGVKTLIIAGKDAATEKGCEAILKEAAAIGPVDAIFNLAVILKDSLCENQTIETFKETLRVKAVATKQLDQISRILCPHLRQFVVFSSMTCGRGNAGQTNYGMANSIMERICETRAADGLPALAIEWGPIGDVGTVAEVHEDDEIVIAGTMQQGIQSCLEQLDQLLLQKSPIVSNILIAEKKVHTRESRSIVENVIKILGMENLEGVSQYTSLAELGLDSITALEVQQLFRLEIDMILPNKEIRRLNFAKISELSQRQKIGGTNVEGKSCTAPRVSDNINLLARTISADDFGFET